MGCLKSLLGKFLGLIIIICFFYFGGCNFVCEKYNEFTNPPREVLIKESKDFGDFSGVSSDYRLTRSINVGGYKKFNAQYLPTGQKITVLDLKDSDILEVNDFYNKNIDKKIEGFLDKFKDSVITLEDLKITQRGVMQAKGKLIPYVTFDAKVKNLPLYTVSGTLGAYMWKNTTGKDEAPTTKIIISSRTGKNYKHDITANFVKGIKFN